MKQFLIILCVLAIGILSATGCTGNSTEHKKLPLTEEEAREIALSHAGLSEDDVTFIPGVLDPEDDSIHYTIRFYSPDCGYEYEIDSYSGKVLEWETEVFSCEIP